ncbi:MAG TPA: HAD family phosphatase [Gammaproteobacteria bacterium]|nr:HAD family phosphatase [Gammaproteobacteria bacterium]
MQIKNVIFDIGNVLVRWAPYEVIESVFPQFNPSDFYQRMYPIWIDLNLGKLSEEEAIIHYQNLFNLPEKNFIQLMHEFKIQQIPLSGSIALLDKLKSLNVNLFSITDNIKEIMEYHKKNSDFPKYFKDIIVSADIGVLKPDAKIYKHLLTKHTLNPAESIFIDDVLPNVEGAIKSGMQAFQFTDHDSCRKKLMRLLSSSRAQQDSFV